MSGKSSGDRAFAACSYMKRKSVDEKDAGSRSRQGKGLRGLSGMTVDLAPFYSTREAFVIK